MRTRLGAERLDDRLVPSTCTWSGSYNTDWGWNVNWVGNVVPGSGDDVVFPSGSGNCAVWGAISVASLTTQSGWGGSLIAYGDITTSGNVSIGSGTVTTDGGHGFGDGDIAVGGDFYCNGTVDGDDEFTVSGDTTLDANSYCSMDGPSLIDGVSLNGGEIAGLGSWTFGRLSIQSSSTLSAVSVTVDYITLATAANIGGAGSLTVLSSITSTGSYNLSIGPRLTVASGAYADFGDRNATLTRILTVEGNLYLYAPKAYTFLSGLLIDGGSLYVVATSSNPSDRFAGVSGDVDVSGGSVYLQPQAGINQTSGDTYLDSSSDMATVWNLGNVSLGQYYSNGSVTLDSGATLYVTEVNSPAPPGQVNFLNAASGLSQGFTNVYGLTNAPSVSPSGINFNP